jgi:SAM-dependent methyltransferase
MTRDLQLRTTFDDVAELYDEVRPGYPEALIDDVLALSGVPAGGRLLEIGCGTGQATLPFARRGYSILCLELGRNLAALAAERCRPYPQVEVQNVAFEEWPLQPESFDLVFSAEAFHWIPTEIGYARAAAALKEGGSLALFWHHSPGEDTPFRRAIQRVYEQRAPHLVEHLPGKAQSEALIAKTLADFDASGRFGPVTVRRHPLLETYTTERYLKLLSTYSPIHRLDAQARWELLAEVGAVIEQFGGTVESRDAVVLYVARVRRDPTWREGRR